MPAKKTIKKIEKILSGHEQGMVDLATWYDDLLTLTKNPDPKIQAWLKTHLNALLEKTQALNKNIIFIRHFSSITQTEIEDIFYPTVQIHEKQVALKSQLEKIFEKTFSASIQKYPAALSQEPSFFISLLENMKENIERENDLDKILEKEVAYKILWKDFFARNTQYEYLFMALDSALSVARNTRVVRFVNEYRPPSRNVDIFADYKQRSDVYRRLKKHVDENPAKYDQDIMQNIFSENYIENFSEAYNKAKTLEQKITFYKKLAPLEAMGDFASKLSEFKDRVLVHAQQAIEADFFAPPHRAQNDVSRFMDMLSYYQTLRDAQNSVPNKPAVLAPLALDENKFYEQFFIPNFAQYSDFVGKLKDKLLPVLFRGFLDKDPQILGDLERLKRTSIPRDQLSLMQSLINAPSFKGALAVKAQFSLVLQYLRNAKMRHNHEVLADIERTYKESLSTAANSYAKVSQIADTILRLIRKYESSEVDDIDELVIEKINTAQQIIQSAPQGVELLNLFVGKIQDSRVSDNNKKSLLSSVGKIFSDWLIETQARVEQEKTVRIKSTQPNSAEATALMPVEDSMKVQLNALFDALRSFEAIKAVYAAMDDKTQYKEMEEKITALNKTFYYIAIASQADIKKRLLDITDVREVRGILEKLEAYWGQLRNSGVYSPNVLDIQYKPMMAIAISACKGRIDSLEIIYALKKIHAQLDDPNFRDIESLERELNKIQSDLEGMRYTHKEYLLDAWELWGRESENYWRHRGLLLCATSGKTMTNFHDPSIEAWIKETQAVAKESKNIGSQLTQYIDHVRDAQQKVIAAQAPLAIRDNLALDILTKHAQLLALFEKTDRLPVSKIAVFGENYGNVFSLGLDKLYFEAQSVDAKIALFLQLEMLNKNDNIVNNDFIIKNKILQVIKQLHAAIYSAMQDAIGTIEKMPPQYHDPRDLWLQREQYKKVLNNFPDQEAFGEIRTAVALKMTRLEKEFHASAEKQLGDKKRAIAISTDITATKEAQLLDNRKWQAFLLTLEHSDHANFVKINQAYAAPLDAAYNAKIADLQQYTPWNSEDITQENIIDKVKYLVILHDAILNKSVPYNIPTAQQNVEALAHNLAVLVEKANVFALTLEQAEALRKQLSDYAKTLSEEVRFYASNLQQVFFTHAQTQSEIVAYPAWLDAQKIAIQVEVAKISTDPELTAIEQQLKNSEFSSQGNLTFVRRAFAQIFSGHPEINAAQFENTIQVIYRDAIQKQRKLIYSMKHIQEKVDAIHQLPDKFEKHKKLVKLYRRMKKEYGELPEAVGDCIFDARYKKNQNACFKDISRYNRKAVFTKLQSKGDFWVMEQLCALHTPGFAHNKEIEQMLKDYTQNASTRQHDPVLWGNAERMLRFSVNNEMFDFSKINKHWQSPEQAYDTYRYQYNVLMRMLGITGEKPLLRYYLQKMHEKLKALRTLNQSNIDKFMKLLENPGAQVVTHKNIVDYMFLQKKLLKAYEAHKDEVNAQKAKDNIAQLQKNIIAHKPAVLDENQVLETMTNALNNAWVAIADLASFEKYKKLQENRLIAMKDLLRGVEKEYADPSMLMHLFRQEVESVILLLQQLLSQEHSASVSYRKKQDVLIKRLHNAVVCYKQALFFVHDDALHAKLASYELELYKYTLSFNHPETYNKNKSLVANIVDQQVALIRTKEKLMQLSEYKYFYAEFHKIFEKALGKLSEEEKKMFIAMAFAQYTEKAKYFSALDINALRQKIKKIDDADITPLDKRAKYLSLYKAINPGDKNILPSYIQKILLGPGFYQNQQDCLLELESTLRSQDPWADKSRWQNLFEKFGHNPEIDISIAERFARLSEISQVTISAQDVSLLNRCDSFFYAFNNNKTPFYKGPVVSPTRFFHWAKESPAQKAQKAFDKCVMAWEKISPTLRGTPKEIADLHKSVSALQKTVVLIDDPALQPIVDKIKALDPFTDLAPKSQR